jgi:hypothetical protein
MRKKSLPFQGLKSHQWFRLSAFAIVFLFFIYLGISLPNRGLFEYWGLDYRTFRASALIAQRDGFSKVYDLVIQEQYQYALFDEYSGGRGQVTYETVPTPYLPVFIAIFEIFTVFKPIPGFVFWVVVNLLIFALYMVRIKRMLPHVDESIPWMSFAVALPLLLNVAFGQVNLLLVICLGEFIISKISDREFVSGLWLAGLLIKPQTLVLIIPGLLFSRRFRILAGFLIASIAVFTLSLLLAGEEGFKQLFLLLIQYPSNLATTYPESMMNWRALAINLSAYLPSSVSWGFAIGGILVSIATSLSLWFLPSDQSPMMFVIAVLVTYAATCTVSWHSHVHMAAPLLVPMILLRVYSLFPISLFSLWFLAPSLVFPITAIILGAGPAHILAGLSYLVLNSLLIVWYIKNVRSVPHMSHHAT